MIQVNFEFCPERSWWYFRYEYKYYESGAILWRMIVRAFEPVWLAMHLSSRKGDNFRLCSADSLQSKWVGNFDFGLTDSRLLVSICLVIWIVNFSRPDISKIPCSNFSPRALSVPSWWVLEQWMHFSQGWHKKPYPKKTTHKTRKKPTLKMNKKPSQGGFFEKNHYFSVKIFFTSTFCIFKGARQFCIHINSYRDSDI